MGIFFDKCEKGKKQFLVLDIKCIHQLENKTGRMWHSVRIETIRND